VNKFLATVVCLGLSVSGWAQEKDMSQFTQSLSASPSPSRPVSKPVKPPTPTTPHPRPTPKPPLQKPTPVIHPTPRPTPRPTPVVHPTPRPTPVVHPTPRPTPKPTARPTPPTKPVNPVPPAKPPVAVKPKPGAKTGVNLNKPVVKVEPTKVAVHSQPSHLDNPVTQKNISGAEGRAKVIQQNNVTLVNKVTINSTTYNTTYNTINVNRTNVYRTYYHDDHYRYYYGGWYAHGFYGGYFYPVRPCLDIHLYFWYPTLYWFYLDSWDPDFYRAWYPEYDQYVVVPFRYARVFYPTETFRDLGMEVSNMSTYAQDNFRTAMNALGDSLRDDVSSQLFATVQFGANDIVINHYENLANQAIVVEGFVDKDSVHIAFKAVLDLVDRNPDMTLVFAPLSSDPTQDDLDMLAAINQKIIDLGGNPMVADQEPDPMALE
jgi:hypothetical protein